MREHTAFRKGTLAERRRRQNAAWSPRYHPRLFLALAAAGKKPETIKISMAISPDGATRYVSGLSSLASRPKDAKTSGSWNTEFRLMPLAVTVKIWSVCSSYPPPTRQ